MPILTRLPPILGALALPGDGSESLGEGVKPTSGILGDGESDRFPLSLFLRAAPYLLGRLLLEEGRETALPAC